MTSASKQPADSLAGKIALITGAARGIGRATALLFAREGAAVAIADISQAGHSVAEEIVRAGGKAIFEQVDVTRTADCQRAVERTLQEFGWNSRALQQCRNYPPRLSA